MSNEMRVLLEGDGRVVAHYGHHKMITGADAPGPFDFFLASLGTCAGYFIARYCEARDLSVEGLEIRQTWSRTNKVVSHIELEVTVPEHFSKRHRKGVLAATNACAVKRLLSNPPEISVVVC